MSITPHVTLILGEGATFTGKAHSDPYAPIGSVRFGEGRTYIVVSSDSVDALLALADAAQEAARQLRLAQLRADAKRRVA